MPRREIIKVLLPAVLLLAVPASPAPAQSVDGPARRSLNEVERALAEEERRAEEARAAAKQARAELAGLRQRMIEAAARLQQEEAALEEAERRLAALVEQERQKLEALRREHRELGALLASLSRLARRSPTALLASAGTPLQTYRSVRLVAAVSQGLKARTQALEGELAVLGRLRQTIAAEEQQRRQQVAKMSERRAALATLVDEKVQLEERLAGESRAAAARADALAKQAEDLRQLVAKLAEAEEQRRRLEAERAEAERQSEMARLAELERRRAEQERLVALAPPLPEHKPAQAEAATKVAAALPAAASRLPSLSLFSEARGKLPMPARGRVVQSFGQRDRQGQASRGIHIETLEAAQVIAPFDGEVVFAGAFRRYGLLLIISLGEGYHILLSGMARLYGVVGQQILAGEPVGEMGDAGARQPRLYVELRRKGEPINPLPWLSAAKGKISG